MHASYLIISPRFTLRVVAVTEKNGRQTDGHMHTHTHRPTTITLAAHARRRGLMRLHCVCVHMWAYMYVVCTQVSSPILFVLLDKLHHLKLLEDVAVDRGTGQHIPPRSCPATFPTCEETVLTTQQLPKNKRGGQGIGTTLTGLSVRPRIMR